MVLMALISIKLDKELSNEYTLCYSWIGPDGSFLKNLLCLNNISHIYGIKIGKISFKKVEDRLLIP